MQPRYPSQPIYPSVPSQRTGAVPPYANWISRVCSYVIDEVLAAIPAGIGGLILVSSRSNGNYSGSGLFWASLLSFVSFLLWLYNRVFLAGRTGQSWGKKVMHTRLLGKDSGMPIGAGRSFLRDVCHILDDLCGIPLGFAWPIWDKQRRTFADMIVGTRVVQLPR